jgi:hypothetical protein
LEENKEEQDLEKARNEKLEKAEREKKELKRREGLQQLERTRLRKEREQKVAQERRDARRKAEAPLRTIEKAIAYMKENYGITSLTYIHTFRCFLKPPV